VLITQAEFARLAGVSRSAVKQAINNTLITAVVEQGGKILIDKNAGLQQYQANSRRQKKPKPAAPTPATLADETGLEMLSWGQAPAKINPPPAQPTTATPKNGLPTDEQLQALIQGLPEDQIPDLNDSRARREHYLAEKARLEALRGRDELVPSDQVKAEAFACARAVRDALLSLADRLAPMLAATTDARECHRLLTEEHRIALRGLADG
jgi:hypothetical protein